MFIEKLSKNFDTNEPIFTEEILSLFNEYSRAQVFRYIDKAKKKYGINSVYKRCLLYFNNYFLG